MFPNPVIKEEPLSLQLAPDNRGTMKLRTSDSLGNWCCQAAPMLLSGRDQFPFFFQDIKGAGCVAIIRRSCRGWFTISSITISSALRGWFCNAFYPTHEVAIIHSANRQQFRGQLIYQMRNRHQNRDGGKSFPGGIWPADGDRFD
jgi:hypothetical protein